jgi:hypothetical protein
VQIASVTASSGTYTITTTTNHPFITGDYVILFYSNANATQEGRFKVTVTAANQFTYSVGNSSFSSAGSYGWAAIENAALEDIGNHVTVRDIKFNPGNSQYFHWGIVIGNDQSFKLDGMSNEGSASVIRCTANFCGALVYARGDQGAAPVVHIEHLEIRIHDYGWGPANDRNLLGRFSTQTFTLARLARTQNYFLRLYDNSSPAKYSRYAAALHVDYPL